MQDCFLDLVGTSQETRDHADQAKGLSEEDGVFGACRCCTIVLKLKVVPNIEGNANCLKIVLGPTREL